MEEVRNSFKILAGNPTGKKPLERPRRRWEDNMRMGSGEGSTMRNFIFCTVHIIKSG